MKTHLASRSWSNESEGRDMYGCLEHNGAVIAYAASQNGLNILANAMSALEDIAHLPTTKDSDPLLKMAKSKARIVLANADKIGRWPA